MRLTVLVTLAAFLGLSAVEAFHSHQGHQTAASCPVCQTAHRTPILITAATLPGPHWISTPAPEIAPFQSYLQFVLVSHGLSPPAL